MCEPVSMVECVRRVSLPAETMTQEDCLQREARAGAKAFLRPGAHEAVWFCVMALAAILSYILKGTP